VETLHMSARRLLRWMRDRWGRWHWLVIAGLALLAFGLGVWGFHRYYDVRGETRSFWDNSYSSLQLFGLEFGSTEPPVPRTLGIARVLAPAVAITAVLSAVAAIFRDQLTRFYVQRMMRNHVVVCGLGSCGTKLAVGFRERGDRVVAVESAGADGRGHSVSGVEACRDHGVVVLHGDAADTVRHGKVGTERAQVVVAVCGDDGVNAEVAIATRHSLTEARRRRLPLRRLLGPARRSPRRPLECFVHIDDPELCRLLEAARPPVPSVDDEPMALDFFNPSQNAAPALLADHPVATAAGDAWAMPARMLVVGLDQMGSSLVVHAARCWRALHDAPGPMLPITVVDREASDRVDALLGRHPEVKDVCEITALPIDVGSARYDEGAFLAGNGAADEVTCAYVCLDDDAKGLSAALTMHRVLEGRKVPIVVRTSRRGGLAALLQGTDVAEEYDNLHAFVLVDRMCRPDALLDEKNELLARAIHERYVHRRARWGDTTATNPNMADWDHLSEEIRESNRAQAEHTATKLAEIGCAIVTLRSWNVDVVEFNDAEIDLMARLEHDRWRTERTDGGWRLGPDRDVDRKVSPALVDWDALPPNVREENRDIVRALPAFLVSAGFLVVRGDVWEIVARAVHDDYVRNQRLEGKTVSTNPSMVPWDALPDTLKASNRAQARHIGEKLAAVGCKVVPVTDRRVVPAVFSRDELERMAVMEHDRWWREREADGWTFASNKDIEHKRSPYLVPYEDLPENVKEYDRNTVRGIPAFVAHAGFAVVRADR
jgi:RyR domain/TrkA-N domain